MEEKLHSGHRNRLREEIISNSRPETISSHKLLEMLLFYGIPQKDTNPIAHELINRFGSFSGVFDADVTELVKVKGMTKNAACLIKLMLPLAKVYISDRYDNDTCLKTPAEIGRYIMLKYFATSTEKCTLLCLNRLGKVLSFDVLAEGDIDSVGVSIRSLIERIISTDATAVVLAHNHPGGIALPSQSDIVLTQAISNALKTISVNFCDHIIIAGEDYISMAQSSEYKELFD